jgi:hypothetical protein
MLQPQAHHARISLCTALLAASVVPACGDNLTQVDTRKAYVSSAPTPLTCVPNLDGKIDGAELAPSFDTSARYLVSPADREQPISLAPRVDGAGKNTWNFSVDDATDQLAVFQAEPITGKWFASSFPQGAFVAPFDAGATVLSVYTHSSEALSLLGLVSREPSPPEGKTLLVYNAPIELYRFPLSPGVSYTVSADAQNSTLRGLPYAGRDTYEVKVDAAGTLDLPDVRFEQALRVRVKATVVPAAGQTVSTRQTQFLVECFGEVMRATSRNNEAEEDFTIAREIRRLGL